MGSLWQRVDGQYINTAVEKRGSSFERSLLELFVEGFCGTANKSVDLVKVSSVDPVHDAEHRH